MNIAIDQMYPEDWPRVSEIYQQGIDAGIATFQSGVPAWEEWDRNHCQSCRLTARSGDMVVGWAALTPTSERQVFSGVAEVSIYIAAGCRGQGVGTALLTELIRRSEENGFWTLEANIFKINIPSRKLHEKCGFREIGIREKLGRMPGGEWRDVVLMDRRSRTVGI